MESQTNINALITAFIAALVALIVARLQYRSAIIATMNQQEWINTLRDTIAEFQTTIGILSTYMQDDDVGEVRLEIVLKD